MGCASSMDDTINAALSKKAPVKAEDQKNNQQPQPNQPQKKIVKRSSKFKEDPELDKEMFDQQLKGERVKSNAKDKKQSSVHAKNIDLDHEAGEIFEIADVGHGDEFMAVLPWKGAIKEPSNHPPINPTKPDVSYEIDFVYGYKSEEVRQNLFYNSKKKPVYMTAALGIIFDPKTRTQKIFGGGETSNMERKQMDTSLSCHTDDITCLAMNVERTLVATGQVGHSPLVFIWDAQTAELKGSFRLPKGMRSVTAIGFSKDSSYIACSDFSNDHNVYCFDWQNNKQLFPAKKTGPDKIFMLDWSLASNSFCTVGPKHVCFWDINGTTKKGSFGGVDKQTNLLCVSFDENGIAYTGAQNGSIIKWTGGSVKSTHQIHKGVVHCIKYLRDPTDESKVLISGSTDMSVQITNPDTMAPISSVVVEGVPRSLDFSKYLLVGMRNGNIVEYDISKNAKEVIMHSHHDGEVWGLCVMEQDGKFITSGDDNKIFMFDMASRKCVQKGTVFVEEENKQPQKPKAAPVGGASTTSADPPEKQSRALAFNAKLNHLAVADNTGGISIRQISLERGSDLNKVINIIKSVKDSKEWIECMSYSPNNERLAAGSHDNSIYVYLTSKNYARYCTLKAHSSFITAFDWSLDSQYIRSNCGGYELLFFNVDSKVQDKGGASSTVGTVWAEQSCKLGWSVEGIFPEGCDGTHINGVDKCDELNIIATGDDYGLINIYRDPVRSNAHQARSFRGHSEHVTKVKFSLGGNYLLSVGGMDQTVIQWKQYIPQQ